MKIRFLLSCALAATTAVSLANAQDGAVAPTPPKYDAAVVNPWGIWAELAGTAWIDDAGPTSFVYAWQVPGEIMTVTVTGRDGTFVNTFELDADGTAVNLRTDPKLGGVARFVSPRPGVSIQFVPATPDVRMVYRHVGGQVLASRERRANGVWTSEASQTRRRATDADVALVAKKHADARAELDREWGVLGRIAGSDWKGEVYVRTWWAEPGRRLRMDFLDVNSLQRVNWFTFERDAKTGVLNETSAYPTPHTVLADGSVYTDDGLNRAWIVNADGRFTLAKGDAKDGRFVYKKDYMEPATRLSPEESRALAARIARAEAAAKQNAAQAADSSGGSGLGSLLGATVGAALVGAAGGNTEQIVGGAFKGASIANADNEMGAALDSAGNQFLGGAAATPASGVGGASVSGVTGATRANFPKKPNLATAACAGFTESNYRSKALEGGPDTQLLTTCGQAFEYYTMYERGIAQGYSEADCNRTYAAHERSARVAQSYASGG